MIYNSLYFSSILFTIILTFVNAAKIAHLSKFGNKLFEFVSVNLPFQGEFSPCFLSRRVPQAPPDAIGNLPLQGALMPRQPNITTP